MTTTYTFKTTLEPITALPSITELQRVLERAIEGLTDKNHPEFIIKYTGIEVKADQEPTIEITLKKAMEMVDTLDGVLDELQQFFETQKILTEIQ